MKIQDDHNTDDLTQKNNTGSDKSDYPFIKEVIKKKPLDKKKIAIGAGIVLAGAVLFGAVAAITFAKVLPLAENRGEEEKVELQETVSEPESQIEDTVTPTPVITEEPEADSREELKEELEDFSKLYRETMEFAQLPEKSIVNVNGVTSGVDWMNNEYENYRQVSGVLIAESDLEYFVLTEYRAVENVDRILVNFIDGTSVDANFQKQDSSTGMAVLKINKEEVNPDTREEIAVAEIGSSSSVTRGTPVLALGSPAGYSGSISYGMITSVKNTRSTTDREYHIFTTDIMGNEDGSGVLTDLDGKIIGVITQKFSTDSEKNIVVAVPIGELKSVIEKLSNQESIMYLGVKGQNISKDLSAKTGIPKGVYIHEVLADSPAYMAGIQNGDVIIGVAGDNIENMRDIGNAIDKYQAGEKVSITAMRKGAEGYVEIVFDVIIGAL